MSTGLGINYMPDPNKTGNFIGRSPLDERKINAALRTKGVLSGAGITLSASAMTYAVAEGVVQMSRGAADGAVIAYVPAKTLTVAATTGSPRIDIIYAYQNDFEQGDADNLVQYGVKQGTPTSSPSAPTLAAGQQEVARFLVPANTSKSNGASKTGSTMYSIPYGGTLGVLHTWTDQANGLAYQNLMRLGNGTIYLPTDRLVEFQLMPTISTNVDNYDGTCCYRIILDGKILVSFEIMYREHWETRFLSLPYTVSAGQHTVAYERYKRSGSDFYHHYGAQNGESYLGTIFQVVDRGVSA